MPVILRLLLTLALLSGTLLSSAACTAFATWPPTEGRAVLAPGAPPCPQLMSTSVSFTRRNVNASAPLTFNLPPNTEWEVWEEVRVMLGPDARKMEPGDTSVFDVRQVRLDGGTAQVDVVYLTPDGVWQMATVHFTGSFGGNYRPTYFQRWFIPVDLPVCNTPPPPAPPPTHPWPAQEPAAVTSSPPVGGTVPAESMTPAESTAPADSSAGLQGSTGVVED